MGGCMARDNYSFQKYKRELAKKKKREEKEQRKLEKKNAPPPDDQGQIVDGDAPVEQSGVD
jgi:hypothetical protein